MTFLLFFFMLIRFPIVSFFYSLFVCKFVFFPQRLHHFIEPSIMTVLTLMENTDSKVLAGFLPCRFNAKLMDQMSDL